MTFEKGTEHAIATAFARFTQYDEITRNWYRTATIIKDRIIENAEGSSGVNISTPCLIKLDVIQNMIFQLKREGLIDEFNRLTNMLQCY